MDGVGNHLFARAGFTHNQHAAGWRATFSASFITRWRDALRMTRSASALSDTAVGQGFVVRRVG